MQTSMTASVTASVTNSVTNSVANAGHSRVTAPDAAIGPSHRAGKQRSWLKALTLLSVAALSLPPVSTEAASATPQKGKASALTLHPASSAVPYFISADPTPPGQPATGYGSAQHYIATTYTEHNLGSSRDGSRVWWYIPSALKNGTSAPVVIFLHGWSAYLPSYYKGMIEHLVRQGIIVVYPQYQKGGIGGVSSDTDQTLFLTRAVTAVQRAMAEIGSLADTRDVVVSGHSLGSLLSLCWLGGGGYPARALVLNNGEFNAAEEIPPFVQITELDWTQYIAAVDVPVMLTTGVDDPYQDESLMIYDALQNAPDKVVYLAQTDAYGSPDIVADHAAPCVATDGANTLDYRFYFAAIDAVLDKKTRVGFDMGTWSDLTPVLPIQQLTP